MLFSKLIFLTALRRQWPRIGEGLMLEPGNLALPQQGNYTEDSSGEWLLRETGKKVKSCRTRKCAVPYWRSVYFFLSPVACSNILFFFNFNFAHKMTNLYQPYQFFLPAHWKPCFLFPSFTQKPFWPIWGLYPIHLLLNLTQLTSHPLKENLPRDLSLFPAFFLFLSINAQIFISLQSKWSQSFLEGTKERC